MYKSFSCKIVLIHIHKGYVREFLCIISKDREKKDQFEEHPYYRVHFRLNTGSKSVTDKVFFYFGRVGFESIDGGVRSALHTEGNIVFFVVVVVVCVCVQITLINSKSKSLTLTPTK